MGAQIQQFVGFRLPNSQTHALPLLALFVSIQIADAFLTAVGIARFGVAAEGNPLLALHIAHLGPAAALSIAKGVAVVGAVVLYRYTRYLMLALLTVMYVFAAIVPWALTLGVV